MRIETPENWYLLRRLDDGVSWICEPHVKEFYRCNIWHVRGRDRDLLVDSGMGVVSLRRQVPLVTERPLVAVASHTHFDHVGAHHEFAERVVHRAEADILMAPTRFSTLADPYVSDEIFTALPPAPYCSSEYGVQAAPATRLVENGDVIDLGDRRFTVIHGPGHSPGSIALWEKDSGILFSGDIVYDGPLIDDCYHSDIDAYRTSLEGLLDLPVRVVHGGHFPSFGRARYRQLITAWLAEERSAGK